MGIGTPGGRGLVTLCVSVVLVAVPASGERGAAQTLDVGDPHEDYLRILQISGHTPLSSFSTRPLIFREDRPEPDAAGLPWDGGTTVPDRFPQAPEVSDARASFQAFLNNRHPRRAANDGFVWQGRGLTTALEVGATARWKALTLTLRPAIAWAQNQDVFLAPVTVSGMPDYAYPWRRIDWPQRFGPDSFWRVDPGQSELRVSAYGATVGISTRNLWWGPGIRSGIIMSNNAGGFPHAFLGTRGPRDIGIGTVEANWIMGRLSQSDYFDPSVESDRRFVTGVVAAYSPSFLEGLSLGLTRIFYGYVPDSGQPLSDFFLIFRGIRKKTFATPDNPRGDDERDQMASVFARWVLPESGFEVYAEWARNDHPVDVTDLVQEPEHSQGYTLGLQKALELEDGRLLALRAELTHLQREPTFLLRAVAPYYTHHIVTQGYTHRGQIVGAGIGPSGIQQHLGADLYAEWGRAGVLLQRRVHDNDAFYAWAEETGSSFDNHDVSIDVGVTGLVFYRDFELGAGLIFTRELNRWFFGPKMNKLNVSLSARWRPGAGA